MVERTREAPASETLKGMRRALGGWLKARREEAGLSQAELAEHLGLRYYSFISQVENGMGRIPQDLYGPWADALEVDRLTFALRVLEHLEPGLHQILYADAGADGRHGDDGPGGDLEAEGDRRTA